MPSSRWECSSDVAFGREVAVSLGAGLGNARGWRSTGVKSATLSEGRLEFIYYYAAKRRSPVLGYFETID